MELDAREKLQMERTRARHPTLEKRDRIIRDRDNPRDIPGVPLVSWQWSCLPEVSSGLYAGFCPLSIISCHKMGSVSFGVNLVRQTCTVMKYVKRTTLLPKLSGMAHLTFPKLIREVKLEEGYIRECAYLKHKTLAAQIKSARFTEQDARTTIRLLVEYMIDIKSITPGKYVLDEEELMLVDHTVINVNMETFMCTNNASRRMSLVPPLMYIKHNTENVWRIAMLLHRMLCGGSSNRFSGTPSHGTSDSTSPIKTTEHYYSNSDTFMLRHINRQGISVDTELSPMCHSFFTCCWNNYTVTLDDIRVHDWLLVDSIPSPCDSLDSSE